MGDSLPTSRKRKGLTTCAMLLGAFLGIIWVGLNLSGCSWAFDIWHPAPQRARWAGEEESRVEAPPTCNRWPAIGDTVLAGFSQTASLSSGTLLILGILANSESDATQYGNREVLTVLVSMVANGLAHVFFTASTVGGWAQYARCTEERDRFALRDEPEQIVAAPDLPKEDRSVPARNSNWYIGFGHGLGLGTIINPTGGVPVYHLTLEAGWIINPHFTLGAKTSHTGLLIFIGDTLLEVTGRWYPWSDDGFYVGAGLGLSMRWYLEEGQDADVLSDLQLGLEGTIAYEFRLGDSFHLGLGLVYQTQWWPGSRTYFHLFSIPISFGWY